MVQWYLWSGIVLVGKDDCLRVMGKFNVRLVVEHFKSGYI